MSQRLRKTSSDRLRSAALVALGCGLSVAAAQEASVVAIRGGTVHVGDGTVLEEATVLIRRGKIAEVGRDVAVPENARVIEAAGLHVHPGLIDLNSTLFVDTEGRGAAALTSDVRDALDTFGPRAFEDALSRGVTAVYVAPRERGPLGGVGALLKLAPGRSTKEMLLREKVAIELVLSQAGSNPSERLRDYKAVEGQLAAIEKYIESWNEYDEKLAEYEKELEKLRKEEEEKARKEGGDKGDKKEGEKKEGEKGEGEKKESPEAKDEKKERRDGPPPRRSAEDFFAELLLREDPPPPPRGRPGRPAPASGDKKPEEEKKEEGPKKPEKPQTDPAKEVLRAVFEGKLSVHARAHFAADIVNLLELQKKHRFTAVLFSDGEAGALAGDLEEAGIPVVWHADPLGEPRLRGGAVALKSENVEFAIAAPGGAGQTRHLPLCAGVSIAAGLDEAAALRALTGSPARILGADGRIGTLRPGLDADVVISEGLPWTSGCRVREVLIEGRTAWQR